VVQGLERLRLLAISSGPLTFTVNSRDDSDGGLDQNGNPIGFYSPDELDLCTAFSCVNQHAQSNGQPRLVPRANSVIIEACA
jgi:hypothetical protein